MDAIQEFWMSEDLLEQLLPMLDLPTTLALASVNPLAVFLLCRPLAWRRFLKRSFKPTGSFRQMFRNANMISELLKMANVKESRFLGSKDARESLSLQLLDFVDHICQVFPGLDEEEVTSHLGRESKTDKFEEIKLLLGGKSRSVSLDGFLILDRVDWYLGSNAMVVEEVTLNRFIENLYTEALPYQISRQQAKVKMVKIHSPIIFSQDGRGLRTQYVDHFLTIIRNSSSWSLNKLWLHGFNKASHDESIWSSLAEISSKGKIGSLSVDASALGCRDAVREVWLATTEFWSISGLEKLPISCLRENEIGERSMSGLHSIIWKEDGEVGWERIMGMITEKEEIAKREENERDCKKFTKKDEIASKKRTE